MRLYLHTLILACTAIGHGDSAAETDTAVVPCVVRNDITPICDLQRPEDLVRVGDSLIISEYGTLDGSQPGRLKHYVPASDARQVLYPPAETMSKGAAPDWGDAACAGEPGEKLAPHGIYYRDNATGGDLYVVNHGGREAIERFSVALKPTEDTTAAEISLRWRGCVPLPDGIWANDVVAFANGGLAVTHMVAPGTAENVLVAAEAARSNTGWVLLWDSTAGWRKLPHSDGGLPNGIEVSDDDKTLFINEYFGDRVVARDASSGELVWRAAVSGPDNSTWFDDELLLVASHRTGLDAVFACNEHRDRPCALPYAVVAVNTRDGRTATVFSSHDDDPMGGATVALAAGDYVYVGSFVGDRMIRIKRPPTPQFEPMTGADGL